MLIVKNIKQAVEFVHQQSSVSPDIAIILGSGMGDISAKIDGISFPYADIPGFKRATVPTHQGVLHLGKWQGRNVVAMQGRLHRYEGYSAAEVVFPVRLMSALGAKTLLLTNAAGSLDPNYSVGDLFLLEDHLSLANLAGEDPLRFGYEQELGSRFTSLNAAYSKSLIQLLGEASRSALGEMPSKAVYAYVTGPSFETPAEIRMLRQFGCDLVGMSTVPEVLAARQAGMAVAAISAVTNICVDSVNDSYITNEQDIFKALREITPRVEVLLEEVLPAIK